MNWNVGEHSNFATVLCFNSQEFLVSPLVTGVQT